MSGQPVCPECATPVGMDWEWCHGCGFDPEGKLAEARAHGLESASLVPAPAASGSAFPGAGTPSSERPPPPAPPPAPPAPDDGWGSDDWGDEPMADAPSGTAFPTSWDASATMADPLPGAPAADTFAAPVDEHLDPLDAVDPPAPPPSSFLDDVPTPAETTPARPAGGFSPTGWQNDPPPAAAVGVLDHKANPMKTPALIAVAVAVVLVVGFVFVKMGSNDRPRVTEKPDGPPPPAAQTLNTTPSTLPPTTVANGWVEYRSSDGRYIAGFPVAPQQRSVFVVVGTRTLPAVEVNAQEGPAAAAFAVDTIDIPADLSIPDAQAAFDQLSQHFEVISSEPYSANGLDGVRFTGRSKGADLTGLVYVQGSRIYYLAAVGSDPASFDLFASSFQLLTR